MSQPTKAEFVKLSDTVGEMLVRAAVSERDIEQLSRDADRLAAACQLLRDKFPEIEKLSGIVDRLVASSETLRDRFEATVAEQAVLKSTVTDWEKRWQESDRRRWTIYGVMLATVLTFVANLTLLLLRR